jgi:hypothetical protein
VPRLTYAGVEGLLLELADSSPVRRWALLTQTVLGILCVCSLPGANSLSFLQLQGD